MPQKDQRPPDAESRGRHELPHGQSSSAAPGLTPAAALRASAAAQRAHADALEALANAIEGHAPAELLDAKATLAEFGVGVDGLKAGAQRGELELVRGPRQRLLVRRSELERWLASRPYRPRPARKAEPAPDLSEWQDELDQQLKRAGGARG